MSPVFLTLIPSTGSTERSAVGSGFITGPVIKSIDVV